VKTNKSQGLCTRVVINSLKGNKDLYGRECGIANPKEAEDYLKI